MSLDLLVLRWTSRAGRRRAEALCRGLPNDLDLRIDVAEDLRIVGKAASLVRHGDLWLFGTVVGDPTAAARAIDASARYAAEILVRDCWGSYVALFDRAEECSVMVDPSGAGQAHLLTDRDLALLTDGLTPSLARLGGFETGVDDAVLAGGLLDPPTLVAAPLLREVSPLVPGVLMPMGPRREGIIVWNPSRIERRQGDENARLVSAVDTSIAAMTGRRPLAQASGGFDSSVILASASRRCPVVGFTVVGGGGDVDEQAYAWIAAEKAGAPLVVAADPGYPDYRTFMDAEPPAHPFLHGLDDVFDRQMEAAVAEHGCDVVLTGQGGDAVFFQPSTIHTSVDRYLEAGVRALFGGVIDDALRCGGSIWPHLRAAFRARRPSSVIGAMLTPHLLKDDVRHSARRVQHPWLNNAERLAPGRTLQIRMLANSLTAHTRRPVTPPVPIAHPLLAQPVLEAVLSMPTWKLSMGRTDRGLARAAFSERLSAETRARRSKGQASAYFSRAAVANLPVLRERLLDGALVERGIIDREMLSVVLSEEHLVHSLDYRALMPLASCEAWLSAWTR